VGDNKGLRMEISRLRGGGEVDISGGGSFMGTSESPRGGGAALMNPLDRPFMENVKHVGSGAEEITGEDDSSWIDDISVDGITLTQLPHPLR